MIFLDYDEIAFRLPCLLSMQRERDVDRGAGVAGRTVPCRIRGKTARYAVNHARGNYRMPKNNRRH